MALKPGRLYGPGILIGKVDPVSFKREVPRGDAPALEQVLPTLKKRHGLDLRIEKFLGVTTLGVKASSGSMHANQDVLIRVTGGAGWIVWGKGGKENQIVEYGDWIFVPRDTTCSLVGDNPFDRSGHLFVIAAARVVPRRGDTATPGKGSRPELTR